MRISDRARPTPALFVALIALVLAMSGAAIAGSGKVKTNDIKNGAVTKKKLAKGAVGSQQIIGKSIKGNRLKDGAVKSKQVAADGLDSSNVADYKAFGQVRVTATEGATLAAARTAAPETELFSKGQLTIYAKCLRDTSGAGEVRGEIYARSSADGGVLAGSGSGSGQLPSNDANLLNAATAEVDRILDFESVATADAASYGNGSSSAATPDGTSLRLLDTIGVKQGTLAPSNGVFGDGNVCLFGLDALG